MKQNTKGMQGMFLSKWRLSSYLQIQEAECGLMCLGAASVLLRREVSATELRQWFGTSVRGASIQQLGDIAGSINLIASPVACSAQQLNSLSLPAIIHWKERHFCLLISLSGKKARIFDPAYGLKLVSLKEMSLHFSGAAMQLAASAAVHRKSERPKMAWRVFQSIGGGVHAQILSLLILSFVLQASVLALPLLSQVAINLGAMQGNIRAIKVIVVSMVLIYGINFAVECWRARINTSIAAHLSGEMSKNLFRHLLSLPVSWFHRRRIADVVSRFDSVEPIRLAVGSGLATLVVDGVLGLIVAFGLLLVSPTLGMVAVLSVLVTALAKGVFSPAVASSAAEASSARMLENAKRWESFRNIETLKLASAEGVQERVWSTRFSQQLDANLRSSRLGSYQQTTASLVSNLGGVAVIYIGTTMIAEATLSIGGLFAFVMYRRYLADKVGAAADQLSNLWSLRYHLERISEVFDTVSEMRWNDRRDMGDYIVAGAVSLKDVSFRHTASEPLLIKSVSLDIHAGEMVCLTGPSGAGKTTILKLLTGLLSPTGGEIRIDDIAVSSMSPHQIRGGTASTMQNDEVFAGSIFDNVTMFAEQPKLDEAIEALRAAVLWDEVKSFPLGLHTPVGEGGRLLSGGQRQRLLLARAFYKQPRIFILDEATANLDVEIETSVIRSLKQHKATKLLVSHSPVVAAHADRVFVIDKRGVREVGRKLNILEAS